MKVYIYRDVGVGEDSYTHAAELFGGFGYVVCGINAAGVRNGAWLKSAALFVIPGGADLLYARELNGGGNENIRRYVYGGGSYLGICAGAYYASSYVEFDKGGELEVVGGRELSFFKGGAVGPILAPYEYNSHSGSRAASVRTVFENIPNVVMYYNGGGYFENADSLENTQVIASYESAESAIVHVKYGRGSVVLSGVHFEYNPSLMDVRDPYLRKILPRLSDGDNLRMSLVIEILKILRVGNFDYPDKVLYKE